jgi:cytochrome c
MSLHRHLLVSAFLLPLASPLAPRRADAQAAPRPERARPGRLGIGRPATREEIARLDIDVMPDGRGLPPGTGTPAQGAAIYATRCAACHGAQGEGTRAGAALVGRTPNDTFDFASTREKERAKTVGNYWPYATTVFDYVRRAMPFDRPGSLTDPEVYAVTAYLLQRNGIVAADAVMDATTLPRVRMPALGHFVRDDREKSKRVR